MQQFQHTEIVLLDSYTSCASPPAPLPLCSLLQKAIISTSNRTEIYQALLNENRHSCQIPVIRLGPALNL